MICTGTQGQTVLDFYLTLNDRPGMEECRGPIVYLQVNQAVANRLHVAAHAAGMEEVVPRAFISLLTEDNALFGSCMAHWLDLCSLAYGMGEQMHRHDISEVGDMVFKKACSTIGWDHKELDNYLQSWRSDEPLTEED